MRDPLKRVTYLIVSPLPGGRVGELNEELAVVPHGEREVLGQALVDACRCVMCVSAGEKKRWVQLHAITRQAKDERVGPPPKRTNRAR